MSYTARAIVEIVGSPEEHIKKVLEDVQKHLKTEQNIKIISSEPSEVEKLETGDMFSGFLDIEFKVENLSGLSQFCMEYMPASIEIVDVDKLTLNTSEMNNLFNDFLSKLHHYNLALFNAVNETKKKQN